MSNKIICDICGTSYASSSECCPICGFTNNASDDLLDNDVMYDELPDEEEGKTAPLFANGKKKTIFDFDEVNTEDSDEEDEEEDEEEEDEDYDEEEQEEAPRHNTFVVILLTILIVALLAAAGFIFFRYFLPNRNAEETLPTVPTTAAVQETETIAADTEPTVPCQQMAMTNAGVAELSAEGQQFLLHIKALPENTTDKIIYTSADESVATVTEDGKITAVSEGETIIYISCGKTSMECPVIVKYVEETVPPTTEAVAEETEASVQETSEGESEADNETEAPEETEAAANAGLKNVKLKLKRTDIQLGVYYSFQLLLDCDLNPEEVTWTSEHPHIAKVDEQGNVTAVKEGTTSVTAKYGDQEVQCMVRCVWY